MIECIIKEIETRVAYLNKKTITINKDMNIQKDGLVLLDYKILGNEYFFFQKKF